MKLVHSKWPELQKYWDVEYGMSVKFADCDEIKVRSDGHYAVVRQPIEGEADAFEIADLTYVNGKWDMQNDGFDVISGKDWKNLSIDQYCDSFRIPGKEGYE